MVTNPFGRRFALLWGAHAVLSRHRRCDWPKNNAQVMPGPARACADPARRGAGVSKPRAYGLAPYRQTPVLDAGDQRTYPYQTLPVPAQGLYSAVRRKAYRKRTDGRLRWVLGPGLEMAVGVYVLLKRAKPGGTVWVHAKTNEELIIESANICQDTGALGAE